MINLYSISYVCLGLYVAGQGHNCQEFCGLMNLTCFNHYINFFKNGTYMPPITNMDDELCLKDDRNGIWSEDRPYQPSYSMFNRTCQGYVFTTNKSVACNISGMPDGIRRLCLCLAQGKMVF